MSKLRFASIWSSRRSRSAPRRRRSSPRARPPRRPRRRTGPVARRVAELRDLLGDLEDVELPEPLSLMPGPSATESRWAPTTIVRSLSPLGLSAITFISSLGVIVALTAIRTVRAASVVQRQADVIADHHRRDRVVERRGRGDRRLARPAPKPSLQISSRRRPASKAFSYFCVNGQVPRWTRATRPVGHPREVRRGTAAECGPGRGRLREVVRPATKIGPLTSRSLRTAPRRSRFPRRTSPRCRRRCAGTSLDRSGSTIGKLNGSSVTR